MEQQSWLHLLTSLLVYHRSSYGRIWILVILIGLNKFILTVELLLAIGNGWQSLLNKLLESLNIEYVGNQANIATEFQERPGNHRYILLFDILPIHCFLAVIEVVMQPIDKQSLQLIEIL